MEGLWQDVKYGMRRLRQSPGFALLAIVSLALGIAANTAIFSVFNSLLLRPLPGTNSSELATLYTSDHSGPLYGASSYADFSDIREKNESFTGIAVYSVRPLLLTPPGGTEGLRAVGQIVSGNYFELLGVKPAMGRTFAPEEDKTAGTHPVVVLGHGFWMRKFGGDVSVVGKSVQVNGLDHTVIGIAPQGFEGLLRGLGTDLYVPTAMLPQLTARPEVLKGRGSRGMFVFARLKPGVNVAQAQSNMNVIAKQLFEAYPNNWTNRRREPRSLTVLGESDSRVAPMIRQPVQIFLALLLVVVGMVLLIACINVANLLLARAAARRKEIAIRISQGAGRWRLIRQLLTESVLLSFAAGAAGVLLAIWIMQGIEAFQPPLPVTLALDLPLDWRVMGFALGLSMLTGVVFGLVPALRASRPDLVQTLKDEGAGSVGGHRRAWLRNGLVVGQVTISLVLLIGAGLFLRSLAGAKGINPGFDAKGVFLFSVDVGAKGYSEERGNVFFNDLRERLKAMPQVEAVTIADRLPLGLDWGRRSISVEGHQPEEGEDLEHHYATVGPDYFSAMRIPMVRGRGFTEADRTNAPGVVVVNEAFAKRFWPGQEALGKWIVHGGYRRGVPADAPRLEVVGVAKDGKYNTLGEAATPFVYFPHAQLYNGAMTVLVRTQADTGAMGGAVREQVRSLDASLPIYGVTTLEQYSGNSLVPVRIAAGLVGMLGALALVLAGVGIFGVVSYAVSQRTQEIGIRVALGAQTSDVLKLVLRQGMVLATGGVVLGLGLSAAVTRFVTFLLYGVSPLDPVTFIGIPAMLLAVALAASWVPARRAMKVEPVVALRYE